MNKPDPVKQNPFFYEKSPLIARMEELLRDHRSSPSDAERRFYVFYLVDQIGGCFYRTGAPKQLIINAFNAFIELQELRKKRQEQEMGGRPVKQNTSKSRGDRSLCANCRRRSPTTCNRILAELEDLGLIQKVPYSELHKEIWGDRDFRVFYRNIFGAWYGKRTMVRPGLELQACQYLKEINTQLAIRVVRAEQLLRKIRDEKGIEINDEEGPFGGNLLVPLKRDSAGIFYPDNYTVSPNLQPFFDSLPPEEGDQLTGYIWLKYFLGGLQAATAPPPPPKPQEQSRETSE